MMTYEEKAGLIRAMAADIELDIVQFSLDVVREWIGAEIARRRAMGEEE